MIDYTRELPNCLELEKLMLGWTLLDSKHLDEARAALTPADFVLTAHQTIWRRICELYDSGHEIDTVTLFTALETHREAESVGGLTYLISLDEGLPNTPRVSEYIARIAESSTRRKLIAAAEHLQSLAFDETSNVGEVIDSFSSTIAEIGAPENSEMPISTHELIQQCGIDSLLSPRRHGAVALPWPRLDEALSGISNGQVVMLMAATSRGKTSLALQLASHAARNGETPVVWSSEMGPRSLFRRMVTQLSTVSVDRRSLSWDERIKIRDAVTMLDENVAYFDQHSRSVPKFRAKLRRIMTRQRVGLVIVDYLQRIRGSGKNRAQEVSDNSKALKDAALELNLPFVVLSQVDRSSVKGKEAEIGLHSAKESGDIENDADVVLWIEAPKQLDRYLPTEVKIHVGKQREGPAGFSIPMIFRPDSQTFVEISQGEAAA